MKELVSKIYFPLSFVSFVVVAQVTIKEDIYGRGQFDLRVKFCKMIK